jgi:hypothetical protein
MPDELTFPDRQRPSDGAYDLRALLADAVQPFDTDEGTEPLGRLILPLRPPILLSREGILYDGNRRCLALRASGKRWLPADSVMVDPNVNRTNVWESAVRVNAARRSLTAEQKARRVRHLMAERGWSTTVAARAFGVAQSTVASWLSRYPADEDEPDRPDVTVGVDGIARRVPARPDRDAPAPWAPSGAATRQAARLDAAVRSLTATLATHRPDGLDLHETEAALRLLEPLAEHLGNLQREVADALALLHERAAEAEDGPDDEADR